MASVRCQKGQRSNISIHEIFRFNLIHSMYPILFLTFVKRVCIYCTRNMKAETQVTLITDNRSFESGMRGKMDDAKKRKNFQPTQQRRIFAHGRSYDTVNCLPDIKTIRSYPKSQRNPDRSIREEQKTSVPNNRQLQGHDTQEMTEHVSASSSAACACAVQLRDWPIRIRLIRRRVLFSKNAHECV